MYLPKDEKRLTRLFRIIDYPDLHDLSGQYSVDMLIGLPSLMAYSHRKYFYWENGCLMGYNTLFENKKWGCFSVKETICQEIKGLKAVEINYGNKTNSFITRGIRDHIRIIREGYYLGRFNYLFGNKLLFLGYFTLSKIG